MSTLTTAMTRALATPTAEMRLSDFETST
jgi:hypothetical protein